MLSRRGQRHARAAADEAADGPRLLLLLQLGPVHNGRRHPLRLARLL